MDLKYNEMENSKNKSEVNSFYVILSGLFVYDAKTTDSAKFNRVFEPWKKRIENGNYESTYDYLKNSYYDGYLNNMFPEIRHGDQIYDPQNNDFLNHYTLNQSLLSGLREIRVPAKEIEIPLVVDYIDVFVFPYDIGIFSMKIRVDEDKELSLGLISDLLNMLRALQVRFQVGDNATTMKDFISDHILSAFSLPIEWQTFNPQLKSYTVIDLANEMEQKELDYLLYDMGNVSPLGSAAGNTMFSPSDEYYSEQMSQNKISIFKNWSALSLYDTFTRISVNFPDRFKTWEYDFYNVYVYSLYMKTFLYLTNTRLSDVTILNKENEAIRDRFVEFVNDYHHTQISYKFLPDLLKDKMAFALDIPSELDSMEVKISRINQHVQERRQQRMNFILVMITFLSLFSLGRDVAAYLIDSGVDKKLMHPFGTAVIIMVILASVIALVRYNKK
ncbi:MAG: hypothetical protein C0599_01920 [Salinivirgaceae bacterium]|nr:MAG: hypothetical protein C0599_01920 [Salinivirgaceae bacterium]